MVEQVRGYLEKFPRATQEKLLRLRSIILEQAPDAQEAFAYGMLTAPTANRWFTLQAMPSI